jgi:hypothetical protein
VISRWWTVTFSLSANDLAFRAGQRLFLNRKELNFEDFFGLLKWFHEVEVVLEELSFRRI